MARLVRDKYRNDQMLRKCVEFDETSTHAGQEGGSFPIPTMFEGPRHRSQILKRVFQMASF